MPADTRNRFTTRITDHAHKKLKMAADITGTSVNQFVVQAALERAERVINNKETVMSSRRESLRLLELLDNPPPLNRQATEDSNPLTEVKK
jgi:uncharacterized protein (DUF1778 family)